MSNKKFSLVSKIFFFFNKFSSPDTANHSTVTVHSAVRLHKTSHTKRQACGPVYPLFAGSLAGSTNSNLGFCYLLTTTCLAPTLGLKVQA
jgi:hypothetical protein